MTCTPKTHLPKYYTVTAYTKTCLTKWKGLCQIFIVNKDCQTTEELDDFTRDKRHKLIVVDDLMHEVMRNKDIELLFTQETDHKCVSVILITQNLFPGGKHARTIALNTWYMVLLKNLRDV